MFFKSIVLKSLILVCILVFISISAVITIVYAPTVFNSLSRSSAVLTSTTGPNKPPIVPAFSPDEVIQLGAKPSSPPKLILYF